MLGESALEIALEIQGSRFRDYLIDHIRDRFRDHFRDCDLEVACKANKGV